jgi:tRNA (guanine37-N1)-methyltransferase
MTKKIDIITIFPEYFDALEISLLGKAIQNDLIEVNVINLRDFAPAPHHNVDDTPYGGGAGMVMRADVLQGAINSCLSSSSDTDSDAVKPVIVFTSPAGIKFDQQLAHTFNEPEFDHIIFICGRFEGYDARLIPHYRGVLGEDKVIEVSIGDYVLNGGEVAVLVMIEAISRLIPGFMGNPESLIEESHELTQDGETLLEYPNFTKPRDFEGIAVPDVLLSGNHAKIAQWRMDQSLIRTVEQSSPPCHPEGA